MTMQLGDIKIYNLFKQTDMTMLEINPFVETNSGEVLCLDCKMGFDDNAAWRHKDIFDLRDLSQEDPAELEAKERGYEYIRLDGNIGCMVNAANLAHERQKKAEGKKMRDDKEKVQEILFALFEKHQFYNIKDLAQETRQPMAYLKQILKEVCNYSVKPPNRNMWKLKPEYRHYKPEDEDDKKKVRNDSSSDSD